MQVHHFVVFPMVHYMLYNLYYILVPLITFMVVPGIGEWDLSSPESSSNLREETRWPHQLVESFKSTLDEVRESDLLLHVVDISNPNFEEQIEIVNTTISDIGAQSKPQLIIFNKIDAYTYEVKEKDDLTPIKKENLSLNDLKQTWMSKLNIDSIFISALDKINFDELREVLYERVKEMHVKRYPYNNFLY